MWNGLASMLILLICDALCGIICSDGKLQRILDYRCFAAHESVRRLEPLFSALDTRHLHDCYAFPALPQRVARSFDLELNVILSYIDKLILTYGG